MSSSAASSSISISTTSSSCSPIRWRAPTSPVSGPSREEARRRTGPGCRACAHGRHHDRAPLERVEGGDQAVDLGARMRGMSPSHDQRAVDVGRQRGEPGLSEGRSPRRTPGWRPVTGQPAERCAHPRASWPVTTITGARAPRRARRRATWRTMARRRPRPAACCAGPCVATGRRPGSRAPRSGAAAASAAALASRGCGRRDLLSSPPTPMRHDVPPRHLDAGADPLQHPVEAVRAWPSARSPAARSPGAAEPAEEQQVAGIDRHAEMLDHAAGGLDRGRQHVACGR